MYCKLFGILFVHIFSYDLYLDMTVNTQIVIDDFIQSKVFLFPFYST